MSVLIQQKENSVIEETSKTIIYYLLFHKPASYQLVSDLSKDMKWVAFLWII